MKAKVNFDGNWLSEIEINSYRFSMNKRFKRGLKTFFIFFGVAIFSVLIPVLHFFLVPVFLILSGFFSYRKFKEILSIDLTGVICPQCKICLKDSFIGLRENDLVVRLGCDRCRKNLTFVIEDKVNELSKI